MWMRFLSDMETPVSAMMKLAEMSDYHLLFESVEGGETRARYSIIALDPDLLWKCVEGKPYINRDAKNNPENFSADGKDVFASLRKIMKESELEIPVSLPPMASGLFGYMGYDMVKLMENLPDKNPDNINIPLSVYMRPQIVIVFDSVKDEAMVITSCRPDKEKKAEEAYEEANNRIEAVIAKMKSEPPKLNIVQDSHNVATFKTHTNRERYHEMVNKAKEYIAAGDIFQVVPSRRFSRKFSLPPIAFYRSLRHLNPSPYLFYLKMGDFFIIGSSPEILVRLSEGIVTIRPIAGTRKRGKDKKEDLELEKDLLADEKELAEHLMLLDLGRNDVGRVAKTGTVKVTDKMTVERYSHVMHIVSNVEGEIAEGKDCVDALIAGFPAGTVSGAPKIRAMEIIDELEDEKRSFYAGTVGYISAGGDMDTCIALRTALIKDGMIYLQAGGGVVADSDPEAEFQETQNKAAALQVAANRAEEFL